MKWTDDRLDILQNLEFAETWRRHPEMTDHVANRVYEAAFQLYRAEMRGHQPSAHTLTGLDLEAFDAVKAMCEFRLGRSAAPIPGVDKVHGIPMDLLVQCLRELQSSVERHTKLGGRQGYLTFIDGFFAIKPAWAPRTGPSLEAVGFNALTSAAARLNHSHFPCYPLASQQMVAGADFVCNLYA